MMRMPIIRHSLLLVSHMGIVSALLFFDSGCQQTCLATPGAACMLACVNVDPAWLLCRSEPVGMG